MKFLVFAIVFKIIGIFAMELSFRKNDSKSYEKVIHDICDGKLGDFTSNEVQVTQNGCGPEFLDTIGFSLITNKVLGKKISQCCNTHDHCYGICVGGNAEKMMMARRKCDEDMRDCITNLNKKKNIRIFRKLKNKISSEFLFETVNSLGDKPYLDAQTKFCRCKQ